MVIDIVAIIPFDHMFNVGGGNGLIRVARIGKLYKLVKITRLVRLLKIIKSKGKTLKRMSEHFKISAGAERILCFIFFFILVTHMMACIWIFSAEITVDTIIYEDENGNKTEEENNS